MRVIDNGIRSFIPPTFCFELRNADDELVETVSRVGLAQESGAEFDAADLDAVEELQRRGLMARGVTEDYDAGPQARIAGRRFTITELVG